MVELKGYKVNKAEIESKVKPGTQLKLQNQVKYNVNYIDADNKCIGMLEFRITDADMNPFEVKIEMAAEFSFGAEDDKADIHVQSFDQLFPYLRMIISNLTSLTGMPALFIPIMRLNKDTVSVNSPADKETSKLN
jgi:preprotein translocase subunit SecB